MRLSESRPSASLGACLGNSGLGEGPEIPVGEFLVEALVERGGVEGLLPGGLQLDEVGEAVLVVQRAEGKVVENLDMGAMGVAALDVLDEGDLFEDVLAFIAFVQAAVDDGQRQRLSVAEQHEGRHGEELVEFAGDAGEGGARVVVPLQFESEEEVGIDDGTVVGAFALEEELLVAGGADFVVGQLEEEVDGFPFAGQGVLVVERFALGEGGDEGVEIVGAELEPSLAGVAEHLEQMQRGFSQRLVRECLQRGLDGLFDFLFIHGWLITSQVTSSRSVLSCTCSCSLGRTKLRPDCRPEAARLRNVAATDSTAFCKSTL